MVVEVRNTSMGPSEEDSEPSPVERKKRRKVNHVTKACDACRARKTRCDGGSPRCRVCTDKGVSCTYEKTDGRKNRRSSGNIRDKLDSLMNLLLASQIPTNIGASPQSQQQHHQQPRLPSPPPLRPPPLVATFSLPPGRSYGDDLSVPTDPVTSTNEIYPTTASRDPPFLSSVLPSESRSNVLPESSLLQSFSAAEESSPSVTSVDGPGGCPKSSTTQSLLSTNDLLKRRGTGSHMQFGPTSFWYYAPDAGQSPQVSTGSGIVGLSSDSSTSIDLLPGDYLEWARHLPSDLKITKRIHDTALRLFGAYYAPWCMAVDMSAFFRDMELCNLVTRKPALQPVPQRTSNYSPLLHNCALRLGVHFNRDVWPELADAMDGLISKHCASMLIEETDDPNLSTPKALALYAACLNLRNEESAQKSGYIHFGMAFACVQALGVNLKCGHLVESGQITRQDQALRSSSYWTLFQQDVLRAICAGRPFMLRATSDIHLPLIHPDADQEPWISPFPSGSANGYSSLRSSVFHWSARLACLLRQVVDIALSTDNEGTNRDLRVSDLLADLDAWQRDQPLPDPKSHPVPHLLVMHMLYHLTYIYLLRPYFRAPLEIVPSAAQRCELAADEILELLRTFDRTHGLRNAVASVIPVIFGMATIRLLVLVSNSTSSMTDSANSLDECIGFMDTLAHTWIEARQGLMVIKHLKNEWLPYTNSNSAGGGAGDTSSSAFGTLGGVGDGGGDIPGGMVDIEEILQWISVNGGNSVPQLF